MRGENVFVAAGGIYVKSEQVSDVIAAQVAKSIQGPPSGSAFVRWGIVPRNFENLSVLITGVGRLGNSIIQILNALLIAQSLKTNSVVYHRFEKVGNQTLLLDTGVTATQIKMLKSKETGKPKVIWRTYAMKPEGVLADPCTRNFRLARESLARSLGIETIQWRNANSAGALTIYLRSGDIFSPNPWKNYGQPPWSFYEKILLSKNWAEVRLVCEDAKTPVSALVLNWCQSRGLKITETGARLSDAITEVTKSTSLVSARGTFVPALLFLSQAKRNLYVFHEPPNPLVCLKNTTVFSVQDLLGEYVNALMSKNWKNTEKQRDLMVSYPPFNLSDVTLHSDNGPRRL